MTEHEGQEGQVSQPLTAALVKDSLTNLGKAADGRRFVYLDLILREQRLANLDVLSTFVHIQVLDLSWNHLKDLTVLGCLINLCKLDASHNRLEDLCLDFEPPRNLQEIDLSFNRLTSFTGIAKHRFLRTVRVSDNNIKRMGDGLETLKCLKVLCMANNHVHTIANIEDLPIRVLDLTNNQLDFVENIESLDRLQELLVGRNQFSSLAGMSRNLALQRIEADHNLIVDLEQMLFLAELPLLTHLNLQGNAMQETSMYRLRVVQRLPSLLMLDNIEVVSEEKVAAWNFHNPPPRQSPAASFIAQNQQTMGAFENSQSEIMGGSTVYAT
jgi:Leucine-rich repeat (LRR) protein